VTRLRTTLTLVAILALGATGTVAATGRSSLSQGHTFKLAGHTTRTFRVGYPEALKYGRSRYWGTVRIILPGPGPHRSAPERHRVHILSRVSCEGGSDFCVRVRNSNPGSTRPVRVRVVATTELPPHP
jgi:hypothetical protein